MIDSNVMKDPTWKFMKLKSELGTLSYIYIYYVIETNDGIFRVKKYLYDPSNVFRSSNINKYKKVSVDVQDELLSY